MICHPVRACPSTKARPRIADLNVSPTPSAPATRVACDKSARIPAQVYAGRVRNATWCSMCPIASVHTVSPATRTRAARWYVRKISRLISRSIPHTHMRIHTRAFVWRNSALYTVLANKVEPEPSPCAIFECGANAICRERDGVAICQCTANYIGNPYLACRPECVINPDCPSNLMCVRNKCTNPCAGVCGRNAECSVVNHQPMCTCLPGYTGDPFSNCFIDRKWSLIRLLFNGDDLRLIRFFGISFCYVSFYLLESFFIHENANISKFRWDLKKN